MLLPDLDSRTLLCVDPAKLHVVRTGAAVFVGGQLAECALCGWLPGTDAVQSASVLLIEFPQIYPGPRDEDPNDLLQVARTVGHFERACNAGTQIRVLPREWKGTVHKRIHNIRVLARLTPAERAIFDRCIGPESKKHNVIDAIGLGLWALDRMNTPCVPSTLAWSKGKV